MIASHALKPFQDLAPRPPTCRASSKVWGRFRLGVAWSLLLLTACRPSSDQTSKPAQGDTPATDKSPTPVSQTPGLFEDVTAKAGLNFVHQLADGDLSNIMESDGAGGTFLDYDRDEFMDVYLVNSGPDPVISDAAGTVSRQPNRLFRNRGDGTFEDVTEKAGVAGSGFGTTAAAADYDNDGDMDLYVVHFGGGILYQNHGDGTFEDVTAIAGVNSGGPGISATFLDSDRDGHLDLFVAHYLVYNPKIKTSPGSVAPYPGPLAYEPVLNVLYRNRGNGTFEDASEDSGVRIPGHRAMSVTSLDYDLDGDADLYVSNDSTPNLLLANDGQGHFKEAGLQAGVAFNQFGEAAGSMGAAVGDCNGDGYSDMLVTRFGNASLYINSPGRLFEDRIQRSGILNSSSKYTGWGGNFVDFDNDGDLDVFIANGDAHFMKGMVCLLLENQGQAVFTDAVSKAGPFFRTQVNARGSGAFDCNNDGRLDLLITTLGDRAILLRNRGTQKNHWIILRLEGSQSNRDGFGAQVRVTAGRHTLFAEARCPTSYVFQQDPRLHFGLLGQGMIDKVQIRWPSGQTQTLQNVTADQVLLIREPGQSRWTKN